MKKKSYIEKIATKFINKVENKIIQLLLKGTHKFIEEKIKKSIR